MEKNKFIIKFAVLALTLTLLSILSFYLSEQYISLGNIKNDESYKEALLNYDKAEVLNPFNGLINTKKAKIYEKNGDETRAIIEYENAVSKNINDTNSKSALIELLVKNQMAEKSIKYLLLTTKNDLENEEYFIGSSKALFVLNRKDDANKIIEKIKSNDADIQRSIYSFLNNNYEKAREEARKINIEKNVYITSVTKETNNINFYKISVAQSINEIKQPYFGQIILENMLKDKIEYRDVYLYLGNSYLLQNNLQKAKENLLKAKENDSIYGLTYYLLAQVEFKENNNEEGSKNLELAKKYGYTQPTP
jgi:tetratricopeptide (TPR) repeat protein